MSVVALKMTERSITNGITGYEEFDLLNDHLTDHGGAIYPVKWKFSVAQRLAIKEVILYLDENTAYKGKVVSVGLPGITKMPLGMSVPRLLDIETCKGWFAIDGIMEKINPADYILESDASSSIIDIFQGNKQSRVYVIQK